MYSLCYPWQFDCNAPIPFHPHYTLDVVSGNERDRVTAAEEYYMMMEIKHTTLCIRIPIGSGNPLPLPPTQIARTTELGGRALRKQVYSYLMINEAITGTRS